MRTQFSAFLLGFVAIAALSLGCQQEPPEPVAVPELPEPVVEAPDAAPLAGKTVAILIAEGFHSGETVEPRRFLAERGAKTVLLGPAVEAVTAYNDDTSLAIEMAVADADPADYDALVLPGGHGPSVLREHEPAVDFARRFFATGKPVAAICHGPQLLITAGVVEGRAMTCFSDVADEVREAGGEYRDEEVVVDGNLITSRVPQDIPAFNEAILGALN